jgi:hypothetical protein
MTMASIGFALLALGIVLLALTPVLERVAGDPAATSALLGGFVSFASSALTGLASSASGVASGFPAHSAPAISLALLAWAAVAYVLFISAAEEKADPFEPALQHCAPVLVYGAKKAHHHRTSNLRVRLETDFDVVPTNSRLHVRARAAGRAYYGLYFKRKTIVVTPDVVIECLAQKDGSCRAVADVRDMLETNVSPVSVSVDHAISQSGNEVTVKVTMTGAVSASGGSIGASGAGFGASIGLTGAATSSKVPMGLFIWRCEPKA